MIRIHLCQIWYNPAYFDAGSDLLEEPAPPIEENIVSAGQIRQIPSVAAYLTASRSSYINHISDKLISLLRWSHTRKADVVVFPEYSVPLEVLPQIRDIAKQYGMLVVAGTHRVRFTDTNAAIYSDIGLQTASLKNGTAIAPIILPSGLVRVSSKKFQSKWEPNLTVDFETDDIHQVTIGGTTVRLGVAPCIDSLQLNTVSRLVADKSKPPHVIICPALSPSVAPFVNIGALLASHEVLFAFVNSAGFGGTCFNVPHSWQQYLPGSKIENQNLQSNTEAILEIDLEIDSFFVKKGSVDVKPPCSSIKSFPIIYPSFSPWVNSYNELETEVIDLLNENDPNLAIDWIDNFLTEQPSLLPECIVSKLKYLRYGQLVTFYGDVESVRESFLVAKLDKQIRDTPSFFAQRLKETIDLVTNALVTSTGDLTEKLIVYLRSLKNIQDRFGFPVASSINAEPISVDDSLAEFSYRPSEASLSAFQNRGTDLDYLKNIVNQASEKVIFITGMPGIGKTALVKALFLKVLPDWRPIWVHVAPDSGFARVVATIGQSLGVAVDVDSLSTASQRVFTSIVTKLLNSFFNTERNAIIVDDLRYLRQNTRDFNQFKIFVEAAAKPRLFKGSRLILLSSLGSAPSWVNVAGIARMHLKNLEERYVWRILEYQLRTSGLVSGEVVPDIPQRLIEVIQGHPLTARVVAEASRRTNLLDLSQDEALKQLSESVVNILLTKVTLSREEQEVAAMLSVFRLPMRSELIRSLISAQQLDRLVAKGFIDFDGTLYAMHPVIRNFVSNTTQHLGEVRAHKMAADYYRQIDTNNQSKRRRDINIVAELVHHLALAHDFTEIAKYRNVVFEELYPAARQLYQERVYDKALDLFLLLADCRPNDPNIWAYIGRCHGRRGQWTDCDAAFEQAVHIAQAAKLPTWWLHRDWGHIRARFNFWDEASKHYRDAEKVGGSDDPSVIAGEAYMEWKTGSKPKAREKFERVLKYNPGHCYTLQTYSKLLEQNGETTRADELRNQLFFWEQQMITPRPYDEDADAEHSDD